MKAVKSSLSNSSFAWCIGKTYDRPLLLLGSLLFYSLSWSAPSLALYASSMLALADLSVSCRSCKCCWVWRTANRFAAIVDERRWLRKRTPCPISRRISFGCHPHTGCASRNRHTSRWPRGGIHHG